MNTEQLLTQIIANQERIDRKLSLLVQEKNKVRWVRAPVISKMTGWDKNGMRRARENRYVVYKEDEDGKFLYNPDSIHPIHLKK